MKFERIRANLAESVPANFFLYVYTCIPEYTKSLTRTYVSCVYMYTCIHIRVSCVYIHMYFNTIF